MRQARAVRGERLGAAVVDERAEVQRAQRGQERGDARLRLSAIGRSGSALEQPRERAEVDARVAAAERGAQPLLAARFVRERVVGRQDLGEPRDQRVDALAQRLRAFRSARQTCSTRRRAASRHSPQFSISASCTGKLARRYCNHCESLARA